MERPENKFVIEDALKESIKESRDKISMLNFNCVTFANIKDIGIVDYKKSSIMVFDNISMAELTTFSHIQDQD